MLLLDTIKLVSRTWRWTVEAVSLKDVESHHDLESGVEIIRAWITKMVKKEWHAALIATAIRCVVGDTVLLKTVSLFRGSCVREYCVSKRHRSLKICLNHYSFYIYTS